MSYANGKASGTSVCAYDRCEARLSDAHVGNAGLSEQSSSTANVTVLALGRMDKLSLHDTGQALRESCVLHQNST